MKPYCLIFTDPFPPRWPFSKIWFYCHVSTCKVFRICLIQSSFQFCFFHYQLFEQDVVVIFLLRWLGYIFKNDAVLLYAVCRVNQFLTFKVEVGTCIRWPLFSVLFIAVCYKSSDTVVFLLACRGIYRWGTNTSFYFLFGAFAEFSVEHLWAFSWRLRALELLKRL